MEPKRISIIPPAIPLRYDRGDILYGEQLIAQVFESSCELAELLTNPARPLSLIRLSCSRHLSEYGFVEFPDNLKQAITYPCPWTGNRYWWWYPVGIVTTNPVLYNPESYAVIQCKSPFTVRDHLKDFTRNGIISAMMGHGYTSGTLPSDGSGERLFAFINLDNGDSLLVLCWMWYNK